MNLPTVECGRCGHRAIITSSGLDCPCSRRDVEPRRIVQHLIYAHALRETEPAGHRKSGRKRGAE